MAPGLGHRVELMAAMVVVKELETLTSNMATAFHPKPSIPQRTFTTSSKIKATIE